MPNGNVGTPTRVFLELIQQCRLPPVVIKKLGLTFPKTRTNKKYGDVPFDYGGRKVTSQCDISEEEVKSGLGHQILKDGECAGSSETQSESSNEKKKVRKKNKDKHWRSDPETKKRMEEKIEENMIAESDQSEVVRFVCEGVTFTFTCM